MRKIKTALAFTMLLLASFSYATILPVQTESGLDYAYHAPEMYYYDSDTLTLGLQYEILGCLAGEVNQCVDMELVALDSTGSSAEQFRAALNNDGQCLEGTCEVGLQLSLIKLLTPDEYAQYSQGKEVKKTITLKLSFRVDEDSRNFAQNFYELTYILNQNAPETVAIDSFVQHQSVKR